MNKYMKLLAWSAAGIVAGAMISIAPQGFAVVVAAVGIFKGFYEFMRGGKC